MPRFFVQPEFVYEQKISIRGGDSRHITNVLRLGRGDVINVFDGTGKEYVVLIERASASTVEGRIITEKTIEVESLVEITLFQGLPKAKKMDLIVEKCTELGINKIVPIRTARTIPETDADYTGTSQMKVRLSRWNKIARESSKQSGRVKIPEVCDLISFSHAINEKTDLSLIPFEGEREQGIKKTLKRCPVASYPCRVGIFIGPEGGWTKEEIGQARHNGIIPVSLGLRILRTETAAMIACALVLYELEPIIKSKIPGVSDN